jgi:phospholipase C
MRMRAIRLFAIVIIFFLLALFPILVSFNSAAQTSGTSTPIKHLIVIMLENHSFDNFFGVYPSGNQYSPNNSLGLTAPTNLLSLNGSVPLIPIPPGNYSTLDPVEGYDTYHNDWNNGKMDGFKSNSGPQSMTYFTSSQMALEWDWAEEYGLGDMYFSSYLSETAPNRLMSLAGETPVTADYGPPPNIPLNHSIFYELSNSGVSWNYFIESASGNNYPLNFFSGINQFSGNVASWNQFYDDLSSDSLPSISWMNPLGGGAQGIDQHPSESVLTGELWLLQVVNAVMNSPEWSSSAIFITYDEGGGYFDQVPPPSLDGVQFGFRVPFIVISPFAKENYVSHTILNHGSILAFIDYNWKLRPLNQFVSDSNIPLDFFDFNHAIRSPIILNQTSQFPLPPQIPFGNLSYARTGSSASTLSGFGQTQVFYSSGDQAIQRQDVLYLLMAIVIGFGIGLVYLRFRK